MRGSFLMLTVGMSKLIHGPAMLSHWPCGQRRRFSSRRACWSVQGWPWKRTRSRFHQNLIQGKKENPNRIIWTRTGTLLIAWMCWTNLEKIKQYISEIDTGERCFCFCFVFRAERYAQRECNRAFKKYTSIREI